ncbi:MAG: prolyl oligopeptidase family serine peptidase [Phycisphaerales bacterium]
MRDPDWVARSPEGAYWGDDGASVYFRQKREGEELTDLYRIDLASGETVRVPDEALASADARGGAWDKARGRKVFSRGGDLFIKDVRTGEEIRLTRTSESERSPSFMVGDGAVMFTRDGTLLVRDLASGLEWEPAEVRFEDPPEEKREKLEKDKKYLDRQQDKYFETLRERRAERDEREDRSREVRAADAGAIPGPFYLPKDLKERLRSLSPSGRWMIVVAAKDGGNEKHDTMPRYVTESGYLETSSVRPKVGVERREDQRLFLIDLEKETWKELDRSTLPTIKDDPLAWLKEKKKEGEEEAEESAEDKASDIDGPGEEEADEDAKSDADDATSGADDAAAGDETPAEKPNEEKKKDTPRPVGVMDLAWRPDGSMAAIMFRSTDNKDRWIAVVDMEGEEPALETVHHLRDEAWINWRFNEMGWFEDASALWYLSEESGYSHLYTWSPQSGETTRLTEGEWEASNVAEAPRGGALYFLANAERAFEYQVWRVETGMSGRVERVTSFEGSVESFELSPSGDRVLVRASSAIRPPELYISNALRDEPARRLTNTVSDEYLGLPWIEPEFVPIEGAPGRPIWTKVYELDGAWDGPAGERPGVVFVHGAGYLQNTEDAWPYYFREQMFHTMLARLGYVVIDMDYRASSGYGRDWRTAIYRNMGRPELEDLGAGIDWMTNSRGVSPERVGLYGGSYGGFMALMALFLEPDRYACGAALRPVTDWAHYNHGYTSNILNTPELDPEAYERSSPIEYAEGLSDPLLICHGMVDDNVLFEDTVRLAQRLIELGKTDWNIAMYPLEAHAFEEASSWLDEYRRVFALFERTLR